MKTRFNALVTLVLLCTIIEALPDSIRNNFPTALFSVQSAQAQTNTFPSSGNVGIGTTSPATALHIQSSTAPYARLDYTGSGQFNGAILELKDNVSTSNEQIVQLEQTVNDGSNTYSAFSIGQFDSSDTYVQTLAQYNEQGNFWSFYTAGSIRLFIDSTGKVGIGTTGPAVSLDLSQRTDALALPSGSTAARPSGTNGDIRYNTTTSAVEAYLGGVWTALNGGGASVAINSSGRLLCGGSAPPCHSASLSYCPYKGNLKTTAAYGVYTIPSGTASSGCLTANLTSMYVGGTAAQSAAANTLYYVYLINVSGTTYLDLETTGHATDSTTGIEIMSGDNTKTLVGMIHTDGSKEVATGGTTTIAGDTNTVATWDNRVQTTTNCQFTTEQSVSGPGEQEINSQNRCYFMSWADGAAFASDQNANGGGIIETNLHLGSSINYFSSLTTWPYSDSYLYLATIPATNAPTEGYHYTVLTSNTESGYTTNYYSGYNQGVLSSQ